MEMLLQDLEEVVQGWLKKFKGKGKWFPNSHLTILNYFLKQQQNVILTQNYINEKSEEILGLI